MDDAALALAREQMTSAPPFLSIRNAPDPVMPRGPAAATAAHASQRHLQEVRLLHHGWLGDHLVGDR